MAGDERQLCGSGTLRGRGWRRDGHHPRFRTLLIPELDTTGGQHHRFASSGGSNQCLLCRSLSLGIGWSAPLCVMELDSEGEVIARLPLAREPDWQVDTEWKHHEFWWAADGGSSVAGCNPASDPDPNCDYPSRSTTQLTDRTNDADPPGVEPGNLTTLGDLTGATLVAMDTLQGHYVYRRTITDHDVGAGRVTVDRICEHDSGSGNPGLGWGSKYYVEGKPHLLDTPGEWWYDDGSGRLYLWPPRRGIRRPLTSKSPDAITASTSEPLVYHPGRPDHRVSRRQRHLSG